MEKRKKEKILFYMAKKKKKVRTNIYIYKK